MLRGYISGYVSGRGEGVCCGNVSRHHELLYLQFRGYVTGYRGMFRGMFAGVQPVCPS